MTGSAQIAPPEDFLERTAFLDALHHHIDGLAEISPDHLPAPRVLAVDAPWGHGKSWIADHLHKEIQGVGDQRPVAFIDAFRHDHHADVFAVIASAIIKSLDPKQAQKTKFLKAAGAVMKGIAPVAVKAVVNVALKMVGTDTDEVSEAVADAKDAAIEGAATFSSKAIGKLFDSYTNTEQIQQRFLDILGEITTELEKPFVVIIDELDRCRPSFALEVLERIKHLFSADNVVFVLFWNAESIHESIRHTYGRDTAAEAYLSKFVALSISLPLPFRADIGPSSRYSSFIEREVTRTCPNAYEREAFIRALAEVAGLFNASLRDVQKAIHYFKLVSDARVDLPGHEFAYLTLLKVTNAARYLTLVDGSETTAAAEAIRFPTVSDASRGGALTHLWATLMYHAKRSHYDDLLGNSMGRTPEEVLVITRLKLSSSSNASDNRARWLTQTGRSIDRLLTAANRAKK